MSNVEQELDTWVRELLESGWRRYKYRGREYQTLWIAPNGTLHRGPYGAWRMMQSVRQWGGEPLGRRARP